MEKVILFQGDSITDCARNRENEANSGYGYATMVKGELGAKAPFAYQFLNRGVSGNRIVDLYARIRQDIIHLKPDYMSILIGINDVWHEFNTGNGVDAKKFEMVYGLLIEELLAELPDLKIMILEPFFLPCEGESEERKAYFEKEVPLRAAAAKRVAEKYGLVFVPLQDKFTAANKGPWNYWIRDGVHPTQAGHYLIKEAWLEGFAQLSK